MFFRAYTASAVDYMTSCVWLWKWRESCFKIQEPKLRALILAHVPHVIRDIRFGILLLRVPDPAVDVFNETHVAQRGEIAVNSGVLGMLAKWHEHL